MFDANPVHQLAQQPSHAQELTRDKQRLMAAISVAPDKFAIVEPYLMDYERPLAIAVQRQFPFSLFADIVLLSSHRLMLFRRFLTSINMFDVNYIDFHNVTIKQGFFSSAITVRTSDGRAALVNRLITNQALNVYRMCQDIETKARLARRNFQLEENRSRTTQMQVNNLTTGGSVAQPRIPGQNISNVGDEENDPFRLGE